MFTTPVVATGCTSGVVFPDGGGTWTPPPVPSFANVPRLLISDSGDDTLAVVSLDLPPKLLGFLPVGDIPVELEGPHHIVKSPDGQFVYVNLSNYVPGSGGGPHGNHGLGTVPGSLLKLRADNAENVAEAIVDRNPGDALVTSDGKTVYVSHFDQLRFLSEQMAVETAIAAGTALPDPTTSYSAIASIDTATFERPPLYPVCPEEHGMALSPDEKTLYVTCGSTDQLGIFDLVTHTSTLVFVGAAHFVGPAGAWGYFPYAVRRAPADGSLWISCQSSGEVRVFEPSTGQMNDSRRMTFDAGATMFGDFLSDGKTFILPHQGDDVLSIIDTSTSTEIGRIPLDVGVTAGHACYHAHVALAVSDTLAYVVCEGDQVKPGTVVAVHLDSRTVDSFVEVGVYPDGIVALPAAAAIK